MAMPQKQKVCTSCGFVGQPVRGDTGPIEVLLLILLLFFFVVPGLIYLFFMIRGQRSCPKCKTAAMIPTDTPLGARLLAETGQSPKEEALRFKTKAEYQRWRASRGGDKAT